MPAKAEERSRDVKIIGIEEHLTSSAIVNAWDTLPFCNRDDSVATLNIGEVAGRLNDLSDERVCGYQ